MSINQKQFEQLSEMGISLWQRRDLNNADATSSVTSNFIEVESSSLSKNQIFNDILLAINSSIGEVTFQDKHLDLGIFNWYFTNNEEASDKVTWSDQKLISPAIEQIANSPQLKKQLWDILSKEI